MAKQKKNRMRVPMIEAHIKQIKIARKDLMQLVQQYDVHANKITHAAFLMDDRDAKLLDVAVSVHNIRNCARSIKIYFDMMKLLLEHMDDDLKTIEMKRNLWKERQEAEFNRLEEDRAIRAKRKAEAERKAIERAEKAQEQE